MKCCGYIREYRSFWFASFIYSLQEMLDALIEERSFIMGMMEGRSLWTIQVCDGSLLRIEMNSY